MKKGVVISVVVVLLMFANSAFASSYDPFTTSGIRAYKTGNLVQFLQQMEIAIKKNPPKRRSSLLQGFFPCQIGKGV
jgi:hypothetical protein